MVRGSVIVLSAALRGPGSVTAQSRPFGDYCDNIMAGLLRLTPQPLVTEASSCSRAPEVLDGN